MPTSRTLDSLVELAPKTSTPSASSSGYGSQAVSSTNLTNDDAMSLRSISVDETPDNENKMTIGNDLQPVSEMINADSKLLYDDTQNITITSNEEPSGNDVLINGSENLLNASDQICDKAESDTLSESGSCGVVKTNLSPGKVVRRKKLSSKNQNTAQNRASFPQARPVNIESKSAQNQLEQKTLSYEDGTDSSTDRIEGNVHFAFCFIK